MSGWTDTPLSELGRCEAELVAARLAAAREAALYTSPLRRARDTAGAIAAAKGGVAEPVDELREIFCGAIDGRAVEEVQRAHPDLWARNLRQQDEGFRWPGGESYREFRARCAAAIAAIAARHLGGEAIVVTHAGVVSQVVGLLRGESAARWEPFRPGNGAITTLEWGQETRRVVTFDDRAHLSDLGRCRPIAPPPGG
jgi:alpha-ribazole phosphatase/probable phosphoglycerate mutase